MCVKVPATVAGRGEENTGSSKICRLTSATIPVAESNKPPQGQPGRRWWRALKVTGHLKTRSRVLHDILYSAPDVSQPFLVQLHGKVMMN